ncbi:MAG TPA: methyltransferase domain-containing protein [Polyangia bacterium]|nr:methyltransferase domain-containing protein [Polyangia bacterium]
MTERAEAFLQHSRGTLVDRFGVWLSSRQIRRFVPKFAGKRIGDFGCGFKASFVRTVLHEVESAILIDVALADDLKGASRVQTIEGPLPDALEALPPASLDVVMIVSVLEHVTRPQLLLSEARRLLAPGGIALINVPSWRGKKYLELAAFRLGLSPACEMDDHKMYYDLPDLWPLLVAAGFRPSKIKCFSHKFGLNTFAACRAE